jgi:hypothetical protein
MRLGFPKASWREEEEGEEGEGRLFASHAHYFEGQVSKNRRNSLDHQEGWHTCCNPLPPWKHICKHRKRSFVVDPKSHTLYRGIRD